MKNNTQRLEVAIRAAMVAGNKLSRDAEDASFLTRTKKESFRDITTEADKYAETKIIETLRSYDNLPILTEESGIIGNLDMKKDYWVIDPLDGTVNYTHRIPLYAVSVAFVKKGIPTVGVIYNPSQDELFYGARGLGVFKNSSKINIIDRKPEDSLFTMAFSGKKHDKNTRAQEFNNFKEVNDQTMGCLRTGSAALNLAYLAEGRLGGCLGNFNKIWDVCAGFVIAELAGATVNYHYSKENKLLVNYSAAVPESKKFLNKFLIR